jgi:hypothetical protein
MTLVYIEEIFRICKSAWNPKEKSESAVNPQYTMDRLASAWKNLKSAEAHMYRDDYSILFS